MLNGRLTIADQILLPCLLEKMFVCKNLVKNYVLLGLIKA